ncbi:C40 family peptidase [Streptomyces bambusae]|uniref:C40 family peptidase n=1 Tax=Streptomyces bambusae TaxID=1550616 RepID=UPI001CFCDA1D|nr:C40 family peptidase [Streptomyces bambusae]MCB5164581.1 C40 family peptidase [Streptomyces bambusae]
MTDTTGWRPHSPTRARPSPGRHRKPPGRGRLIALRAGVTTGVLGTVAAVSPVGAQGDTRDQHTDTASTQELDLRSLVQSSSSLTSEALLESAERHARLAAEAKAAAEKAAKEKAAKAKAAKEKAAKAKAAREKAAKAARAKAAQAAQAASASSAGTTSDSGSESGGTGAAVAAFARAQVGKPYVYGGMSVTAGFDCSGLVKQAYAGKVELPRTSQDQSTVGREVSLSDLQPGDILYWGGKGSATHVAIYVGDGQYVGAQNPGDGVRLHPVGYGGTPSGAVRVL